MTFPGVRYTGSGKGAHSKCVQILRDQESGAVAQACNPSTLGGEVGGSRGQEIEIILVNMVKPRLY